MSRWNNGIALTKESVGKLELRAFDAILIDGELVSQGEDFQLHGVTRLEPGGEISQSG